jgi:D-aminopeptidase
MARYTGTTTHYRGIRFAALLLLALPVAASGQGVEQRVEQQVVQGAGGNMGRQTGPEAGAERPRAREAGVVVGIMPPGPLNAITDVAGVRVGQVTVSTGSEVRTGVTAILPHPGNAYSERVPAAIVVANGFGKLVGLSQVQ